MANTKIPSELSSTPSISDSGDATAITIDSSERVGVGLSSPSVPLHIQDQASSDTTVLRLENKPATAATNEVAMEFWGNEGTVNNGVYNIGRIYGEFDGSNYSDTRLTLGSASGNGTFNDELSLKNGKVGIGTTSPATQAGFGTPLLEVRGSSGGSVLSTNSTTGGEAVFCNSSTGLHLAMAGSANAGTGNNIIFRTGNTNSNYNSSERARITSDGNFLIGTTSVASTVLDGTGGSSNNIVIGSTSAQFPVVVLQSSDKNWLADYVQSDGSLASYNTTDNKETMKTTPAGKVTFPQQPSFRAYTNTAGSTGLLTFTSTGHNIGSHYSTSNGRFTAPVAGRYLFTFMVLIDPATNGNYERVLFAVNGVTDVAYGDSLVQLNFSSLSSYHALTGSTIINLSANDYVNISNSGQSGTYGANYNSFCGQLLS